MLIRAVLPLDAPFSHEKQPEQHGALACTRAPEHTPANAPDLLVIEGDGMRLRQRVKKGARRNGELDNGWRECKVGVVIRCQRGFFKPDGTYQHPEALLQTYLATMDDIHIFGPMLRAEAERRGMAQAREVIGLSDAGHGLPAMWDEHFPGMEWIIDLSHTAGRLAECAKQMQPDEKKRQKLFHRLKGQLFNGQLDKLLRELSCFAKALAPRPEEIASLPAEYHGGRFSAALHRA